MIEWVTHKLRRRYRELPSLREGEVAMRQRPRSGQILLLGAVGLVPDISARPASAAAAHDGAFASFNPDCVATPRRQVADSASAPAVQTNSDSKERA